MLKPDLNRIIDDINFNNQNLQGTVLDNGVVEDAGFSSAVVGVIAEDEVEEQNEKPKTTTPTTDTPTTDNPPETPSDDDPVQEPDDDPTDDFVDEDDEDNGGTPTSPTS